MLIEPSSIGVATGIVKVASLSLSPNVALSLSLTLAVYPYIKSRITLAKKGDKIKKQRGHDSKIYLSFWFAL